MYNYIHRCKLAIYINELNTEASFTFTDWNFKNTQRRAGYPHPKPYILDLN